MNERDELRLRHMRDAALNARQFIDGKNRSDLDSDVQLSYALVHALQVIGEAASQTTPELQAQNPQIAWKNMVGMRHRIVHDYDNVNHDIVWRVIIDELPVLIQQIEALLALFGAGYNPLQ